MKVTTFAVGAVAVLAAVAYHLNPTPPVESTPAAPVPPADARWIAINTGPGTVLCAVDGALRGEFPAVEVQAEDQVVKRIGADLDAYRAAHLPDPPECPSDPR